MSAKYADCGFDRDTNILWESAIRGVLGRILKDKDHE